MVETDDLALINSAKQFLRDIFELDLTVADNSQDIAFFSSQHQLHTKQYPLSSEFLLKLSHDGDWFKVYPICDCFLIHLEIFFIKGKMVLLGPYTSRLLSRADALRIFKKNQLTELSVEEFLSYYNSFPNISEHQIQKIVRAVVRMIEPASATRTLATSVDESGQPNEVKELSSLNQQHMRRLEHRYKLEDDFFEAIKAGNTQTALSNLHSMHQDVTYLKKIGTTLESERVGAAITRTTVRLAAKEAGLSYILSNQLSAENTRMTMAAKSVDEILELKDTMVRNFCKAIRTAKIKEHSALCQSIVYYLEHHYEQLIRMDNLAKELGVSSSYITRVFKKEYQMSPMAYLKTYRMKKAQELLFCTDKRIQDISNMVGVPDANYFVKQFYSVTGKTPSEYRAKHKIGK